MPPIFTAFGFVQSPAISVPVFIGAWSAGGNLITTRNAMPGMGTQNAGLVATGFVAPAASRCTEEYNGSSWSAGGATINARYQAGGSGTQNAAFILGLVLLTVGVLKNTMVRRGRQVEH